MSQKVLIYYFSHWGHTRQFAETIHEIAGGDLFEIKTSQHYPIEHDPCSAQAHQELIDDFRPQLTSYVSRMDQYDIVLIGYPIWWYREPMVIRSFWSAYDFGGKTVTPFCTSGGSSIKRSEDDARTYLPHATVKAGLRLGGSISKTDRPKIEAWLRRDEVIK